MLQPTYNLLTVGRVDDQFPSIGKAIDQHIVKDATVFAADQRVPNIADFESGRIVGQHTVQERLTGIAPKLQPTHVGNVKKSHSSPHSRVFIDNRRVLDGHFPACKIDHPAMMCVMPLIKGCRIHAEECILLRYYDQTPSFFQDSLCDSTGAPSNNAHDSPWHRNSDW
jgi:hypothetical protein